MNKTITLCIMQSLHTVFSIVLWVTLAAIWHKIQYKSLRGFWMHMGVKRPKKGAFLRSAKPVAIAYLFTIAMDVILKLVNGGMTASVLNRERDTVPLPILLIMILFLGFRSGFGEELFFRGAVGNWLMDKLGAIKGNLLQALIFALPHIWTFSQMPGLERILLLINAYIIGLAMGHMTSKEDGCVVPAMFYHGIINIIAIPISWFIM